MAGENKQKYINELQCYELNRVIPLQRISACSRKN